jgi:HAMP domain-containing protein
VLTTPMQVGVGEFQVARPLDEVDRTLGRLGAILGGMTLAAGILAAGAGRLAVRGVMAPVRRLAETAQHVSSTRDLSRRIEADGQDEVSDLATAVQRDARRAQTEPGGVRVAAQERLREALERFRQVGDAG